MNQGLRGDDVGEYVDGDCHPQDGRVVGGDDDDDFPLREGSSPDRITPPEGKSAPAQVSPSGGGASSQKSSLYFFQVKMTYIQEDGHRRWAEEATTHQGVPGGLARPGGLCPPGGAPRVVIGSNISYIFHKNYP